MYCAHMHDASTTSATSSRRSANVSRLAAIANRGKTSQLPPKQVTVNSFVVSRRVEPSNSTTARYRAGGSWPKDNPTPLGSATAPTSSGMVLERVDRCSRGRVATARSMAEASNTQLRTATASVGTSVTTMLTLFASVNARFEESVVAGGEGSIVPFGFRPPTGLHVTGQSTVPLTTGRRSSCRRCGCRPTIRRRYRCRSATTRGFRAFSPASVRVARPGWSTPPTLITASCRDALLQLPVNWRTVHCTWAMRLPSGLTSPSR